MKLIFEVKILKIGRTEITEEHLKDEKIMKSLDNFADKIRESLYKYLKDFKIKTLISYEIQKTKKEEKKNDK